ncbi:MAG: zinc-ribbon domain-containing protein, partial [Bacteroidota bacterium]
MFCTQCSRQVADTSKFCVYCGSALNSGIPHREQTPDNHKKVQMGTQSSSGLNIK